MNNHPENNLTNDSTAQHADVTIYNQDSEASTDSIKELYKISGHEKLTANAMELMLPQLKTVLAGLPEALIQDLVNVDDMIDLIVPIYKKYLSEQEVQAICNFYRSPIGKKYVRVWSYIQADLHDAQQKRVQLKLQKDYATHR
jgi:hypothetical protein